MLRTPSGKIELAPAEITADIPRLHSALDRTLPSMVLIGRRELRTNNSWMHNVPELVKGSEQCTLQVHPSDAERYGLVDGGLACVTSAAATLEARVQVTDAILPGVVSLPHGWGHDQPDIRLRVAAEHPGANVNRLVPDNAIDPLSGNAILNAVPVTVARAGR